MSIFLVRKMSEVNFLWRLRKKLQKKSIQRAVVFGSLTCSLLFGSSNSEKMHVPLVLCQNTRGLAYSREKVAGFIQPVHGIGLVLPFTQEKMNLGRKLPGL